MADAEVVITDAQGVEHVFPPGFDPKRAAAIVRGQSGPIPADQQPPLVRPSTRGFVENIGPSAMNFATGLAQGVAQPVLHPIQTMQSFVDMASHPSATGAFIKDAILKRYGSIDNALGTMYHDPVGAAADFSAVLGAAGSAAKMAGIPRAAQLFGSASEALNPLSIPFKAAAAVTDQAGRGLMQSALKPTNELVQQSASAGVRTKRDIANIVMDEPYAVASRGTVNRLGDQIGDLNAEVRNRIKAVTDMGGPSGAMDIPISEPARAIDETSRLFTNQVNPTADLAAIDAVKQNFVNHPLVRDGFVSPIVGQDIKQGTYQRLSDKYGELGSATVAAEKAGARGLKESIATRVPGVADLNARESRKLIAKDAVQAALDRTGNRDPFGFANVATGNPKRLVTALADRSPWFKSVAARGLTRGAAPMLRLTPDILRDLAVASDYIDGIQPVASHDQTGGGNER